MYKMSCLINMQSCEKASGRKLNKTVLQENLFIILYGK